MFNRQKSKYPKINNPKRVEELLRCCLTLKTMAELLKEHSKLFDFSQLGSEQKAMLIAEDYDTFSEFIDVASIPTSYKVDLFLLMPKIMLDKIDFDKVTKVDIGKIARVRPSYVHKYNLPLHRMPIDGWYRLIKYRKMYLELFVQNLQYIRNKSDIKNFLLRNQEIMPILTVENMEKSCLNAKDWILFLSWDGVYGAYSDEVNDWLDIEFTVDVLSGDSTNTKYTAKARSIIKGINDGDANPSE